MIHFLKKHIPRPLQEPLLILSDWIYRLKLGFKNPAILTDIYGVQFVLYPYTTMHIRWLLKHGMYNKEMAAMKKLLSPSSTVFDIGANAGIVSALIAKRFVPKGKIYAFEPLPDTFHKLKETIALNNFDCISPYNIAISSENGTSQFYYVDDASSELNSLGKVSLDPKSGDRMEKSISVETATLDSFCERNNIQEIDFVKIDVEGFEFEALQGAPGLLKTGRIKYLQFEISETPLKSLGKASRPIFDLLAGHGYTCYSFDEISQKFSPINDTLSAYDNYYASRTDLASL